MNKIDAPRPALVWLFNHPKAGRENMATDVKEVRAQVAEGEARREAQRFSPSFMSDLRNAVDGWRMDSSEAEDRERSHAEWVALFVRRLGDASSSTDGIEFERWMIEVAALATVAHRTRYPEHLLREWEDDEARRAGQLERNRS